MTEEKEIKPQEQRVSEVFLQALSDAGVTKDSLLATNKIPAWLINAILNDDIEKIQKEKASGLGFLYKLEQMLAVEKGQLVNAIFIVEGEVSETATATPSSHKQVPVKPPKDNKFNYMENLVPIIFWLIIILGIPTLLFFGMYNKMAIDKAHSNNSSLYEQNSGKFIAPEFNTASVTVKLEAIDSAWVRIYVDGNLADELTMDPGTMKIYTGNASVKIYTGNAPMLKVNYAGEQWSKLYAGTKKIITWELTKGSQEPSISFPDEGTSSVKQDNTSPAN